ncbi:hypothetical protein BGW80DRAFT_1289854 [Lactifluus volemus]|nr:hypothetical protein BGW80DRAFT_1289854 [Lactifluus volemus]
MPREDSEVTRKAESPATDARGIISRAHPTTLCAIVYCSCSKRRVMRRGVLSMQHLTYYTHFCFPQHIRNSAFSHVNPSGILPSVKGSPHDAFAETCYLKA